MVCTEIIKRGSTNAVAVKALKVRLNDLLSLNLDVQNSNFGLETEAAVRLFQKQNNLLPDGVVGELTWERLFTIAKAEKVVSTLFRFRALEIAKTQLFVREKTGNNDGAEVEAYLKSVGLGKGWAWCMAFVYWNGQRAADALKITNLIPKTAGVMDCYRKAKAKGYVVAEPKKGDQFIMDFGGGKGHTGWVDEVKNNKNIFTVEGNTSADPTYSALDREGNGVFERNRPISTIFAFIRYE